MKELAVVLWAMTASHHEWPMPPNEPLVVVRTIDTSLPALNREEQTRLHTVLDRLAQCATGRLAYDPTSGFYLPEQKADCKRSSTEAASPTAHRAP